jgi:hypothetical protein
MKNPKWNIKSQLQNLDVQFVDVDILGSSAILAMLNSSSQQFVVEPFAPVYPWVGRSETAKDSTDRTFKPKCPPALNEFQDESILLD